MALMRYSLLCCALLVSSSLSFSPLQQGFLRRDLLEGGILGVIAVASTGSSPVTKIGFNEAIALIKSDGQEVVTAVKAAGGSFLYRGESPGGPALIRARPDMLEEETYNSKAAVEYFGVLDKALKTDYRAEARPSTAHVMVADKHLAGQWGEPCSIWPIGSLSFVWHEAAFDWWDQGWEGKGGSLQNGNRGAYFWREEGGLSSFLEAGVVVDKNLPEAIRSGHEIMFATAGSVRVAGNSYVAIPCNRDDEVREALNIPFKPRPSPREKWNNSYDSAPPGVWQREYGNARY